MSGMFGLVWSMSLPIGGLLATMGAVLFSKENRGRVVLMLVGAFLVIFLLTGMYKPKIVPSALFGIGGGLITLSYIGILWNWAKTRAGLSETKQLSSDFKVIGYFFFMIASWYLCGTFGAPSFLLRPELIGEYTTPEGNIQLATIIFISLVLGWIFLLIGNLKSNKK